MAYLMGVDIGTSGTKTSLFDEDGNTVCSSTHEYPLYQLNAGWAEQEPADWWNAVVGSIRDVIAESDVDVNEIKGLGLSGQMHGLVMLDTDGNVLRRSIIWCDGRTAAECEEITELVGAKRLIEITANPALVGFTASKIMWVKKNEPALFEKCAKILLPKDYIRYMLTGEFATDVSDASGMQLLDIKNRCWSDEVLHKLGIDKNKLGKVYESCEVTGQISFKAAAETGLSRFTVVVGGAGDQAAGAVGSGIVAPGLVSSTVGTSGVVFAHMDNIEIDRLGRVHTFCHAVPGKWHVMGVTQGAGLSLQWFRNNFCASEMETAKAMNVDPYYLMDIEVNKIDAGCDGLIYLPYLMGERTPHLDPDARGVFFGLSARHTRAHMQRAVMEGVAYSLLDCMGIINEMGITATEVRASGGGAKSPLWRAMQADMFNTDIVTVNSSEGGALGAALLAGVGAGIYKDVESACAHTIKVTQKTSPDLGHRNVYMKYYPVYKSLYNSLKDEFKKINRR